MEQAYPFPAGTLDWRNTSDFNRPVVDVLELTFGRGDTDHSRQGFEQLTNMRLNLALVSEQLRLSFFAHRVSYGFRRLQDL